MVGRASAEEATFRGLPAVRLASPGGAQAVILLHGGQLVSWVPAGGREWLFLSERAELAPGRAIRGGVPICFPQFASLGPLPKHGLVRTRAWRLAGTGTEAGAAWARLAFEPDAEARAAWPHSFTLHQAVRLADDRVEQELTVGNAGVVPLAFTAALHGYFDVEDVEACAVEGLQGTTCRDAAAGDRIDVERRPLVRFLGEHDRVHHAVQGPVVLVAPSRRLQIGAEGFPDIVLWNPGAVKGDALPDMVPGAWRRMLCVEPGAVRSPVTVAPGGRWRGRQVLAEPPGGRPADRQAPPG